MLFYLTSFEPFNQRQSNGSKKIAEQLTINLQNRGEPITFVHLPNIPVIYDTAAAEILKLINNASDDTIGIISFGEAKNKVQIETGCHNQDNSINLADNRCTFREKKKIVENLPGELGFYFPVWELWNSVPLSNWEDLFCLSISPGNFVCNNTSFRLSYELGKTGVPFTFIHTPQSDYLSEETTNTIVNCLSNGIINSIKSIKEKKLDDLDSKQLSIYRLPRTTEELIKFKWAQCTNSQKEKNLKLSAFLDSLSIALSETEQK